LFDISKEPFQISCPECGKELTVTFEDAQNNRIIECPDCGMNIQLSPDPNLKKNLKDLNNSVKGFKKEIEKLNKKLK
jgi:DNA-directed RNA polymerase subunit RPC12/RpoP